MIWESSYWKDDLLKSADFLAEKEKQKDWPDRSLVAVEKRVFLGFYSIRKLMDSNKVSSKFNSLKVNAKTYPSRGKKIHLLNWHRTDELYDFSKGQPKELSVRFLCNQIIHSYVFLLAFSTRERLRSFYFCSERERKEHLFEVSVKNVIRLFRTVGDDYPSSANYKFNSVRGDYDISQS